MFIDREYRTLANVPFIDRVREYEWIRERIGKSSFIILWGPRNIGKSELLRYSSWRLSREGYIVYYIDFRREALSELLRVYGVDLESRLLNELYGLLRDSRFIRLVEVGYNVLKSVWAKGVVYVFDEIQCVGSRMYFLESLIKQVLYAYHEKPLSVIISSSEGWFVANRLSWSLRDYGAYSLLLDEMDLEHTILFTREVCRVRSTRLSYDVKTLYDKYTGGNPGYILELLSISDLSEWVKRKREELIELVNDVVIEEGIDRGKIYCFIASLPVRIDLVKASREQLELLKALLKHNIVYYRHGVETIVKPQLRVYKYLASEIIS